VRRYPEPIAIVVGILAALFSIVLCGVIVRILWGGWPMNRDEVIEKYLRHLNNVLAALPPGPSNIREQLEMWRDSFEDRCHPPFAAKYSSITAGCRSISPAS
jgi:hypothetical protein